MTITEQMVWAAAFALHLKDRKAEHYFSRRDTSEEHMLGYAAARAAETVQAMRDARNIFERNENNPECGVQLLNNELEMLKLMATGE